jgi:[protein-PII] uridylyltransferase
VSAESGNDRGLVTVAGPEGGIHLPGRRLPSPVGQSARTARARELDAWLADLWRNAGSPDRAALAAVGGLGRRECLPHADLDLVLLHDGRDDIGSLAEAIWYPVWDAKLRLDHSVRTVSEALAMAGTDVKVALGLLDTRHLAGDPALTERLRAEALADWRRRARARLPALRELTQARWAAHGELAFLLEGDLKEARGGLRDVAVLRGIGYAQVAEAADHEVRHAAVRLLDVRHALHAVSGRRLDRLLAEQQAPVAAALALPGRDELARRVAEDARTVGYACEDAWRAVGRWLAVPRWRGHRPPRQPIADGVVACDGEAMLARDAAATVDSDPTLPLRVAAAAAGNGLPIARATLRRLAEATPPLPDPWPARARDALVTLLGSGSGMVNVWEACDRYGLVTRWLPEWQRVRSLPQRNPVHRYTVDRHLVQTASDAARLTRQVARPDLLVLAALLHDIGKGLPGDHSQAGVPVAERVCRRIGLSAPDSGLVCRLVRHHLLLADTATRRDLSDPATVALVADVVADPVTLHLLHALTRADASATGPLAWSEWKAGLVADLVHRVHRLLDTGQAPTPQPPAPDLVALAAGPLPAVRVDEAGSAPGPRRVAVAAVDRRGLLSAVAGVLAVHRLEVLSADAGTIGDTAVVECVVTPRYGTPPDPRRLRSDLNRALGGQFPLAERVAAREQAHRGTAPAAPHVLWLHDAASHGTVLELRAADSPGLLYRVAHALEQAGAAVRAARISTLGNDVVDSFYLAGDYQDPAGRAGVESAVLAAVGGPTG